MLSCFLLAIEFHDKERSRQIMRITRPCFAIVLTLVTLGMLNLPVLGIDNIKTRAALRGLEGVNLQVENLDADLRPELNKGGLTENRLQTAIEQKLKEAGIRVFSEAEYQESEAVGILYVNLRILKPEILKKWYTVNGANVSKNGPVERYSYAVDVELRQATSLLRDPAVKQMAATWSTSSFGLRRLIRIETDVISQVDKFTSAYRAANPK
jgi:hypothetical protein